MRFSIIIPVFNTEQYLSKCLNSILTQSFSDFEVICVDDGSSDGSPVLLRSFAENDNRVKVINNDRGGVSKARNTGLDIAVGDYVLFVDSDDWILPESLSIINRNLSGEKYDILVYSSESYLEAENRHLRCYSLTEMEYPDGWSYYESVSRLKAYNVFGTICGKVYSRDVLENLVFLETVSYHEDMLFAIDACSRAGCVKVIPDYLYVYRIRDVGSQMATYSEKRFLDMVRVANRLGEEYLVAGNCRLDIIRRTISSYYRNSIAWSDTSSHHVVRDSIDWNCFRKASCVSIKAYLSYLLLRYCSKIGLVVLNIAYKRQRSVMEKQIVPEL